MSEWPRPDGDTSQATPPTDVPLVVRLCEVRDAANGVMEYHLRVRQPRQIGSLMEWSLNQSLRRQIGGMTLLAVLLATGAGCGLSRPNWSQPGHLYHQRLRATHFDPYGDTDAAPDFAGSRPRSYARPRSEVERAQWFADVPMQPSPISRPAY